jgi:flagellar L-ring protein precursor FlgH
MFWKIIVSIFMMVGLVGGCAGILKQPLPSGEPVVPARSQDGSLWDPQISQNFLFQDLKASRVNDIVTVRIIENSSGSKNASTETKRDVSLSNELNAFLGVPPNTLGNLEFDASTSSSFEGEGATSRSSRLSASMTARVREVLANGDLVIEGRREVVVNNERQFMVLSGIVRPQDIGPNNTVLSTYLADARIEYTGKGLVGENQRPGWLFRLLTWLWPL